jgi:hypothetical protein
MEKQLINLTKFDIHYYIGKDKVFTLPSSGTIQLHEKRDNDSIYLGNGEVVTIEDISYDDNILLPQENEEVLYIVSSVVANILRGQRNDLLTIGELITDGNGRNIGVRTFRRTAY